MSAARLTVSGPGRWCLAGTLDFTQVTRLVSEGAARFQQMAPLRHERRSLWSFPRPRFLPAAAEAGADAPRPRLEIDLSAVETANSAGLVLLLEWREMARARGIDLVYRSLPDSLQRIAALSNLQSILPVAAEVD